MFLPRKVRTSENSVNDFQLSTIQLLTFVVNCSISHRIFIIIIQAGSISPCLLKVIIFTKLLVQAAFWFHACLPSPALE